MATPTPAPGNPTATPSPIATPNTTNQTKPVVPTAPAASLTPIQQGSNATAVSNAQANPGTVQTGAQMGTTNTAPGQTTPLTTTFQAATGTQNAANKAAVAQTSKTDASNQPLPIPPAPPAPVGQKAAWNAVTGSYDFVVDHNAVVQNPPKPVSALTADAKNIIQAGITPTDSGILTTDNLNLAKSTLGGVIDSAAANPLSSSLSASNASTQALIDSNTQMIQQAQSYLLDPNNNDPIARGLMAQQQLNEQKFNAAITDIHTQTDQQLVAQAQQNRTLEGQAKAAVNAAGQVGSMVGQGFIAAQMQNNLQALNAITASEQHAITEAQTALAQNDIDVAMKMADLHDKRVSQANDLLSQNASLSRQMFQDQQSNAQIAQQAKLTEMQLRSAGKTDLNDFLSTYSKQNLSPSAIPDSVWQQGQQQYLQDTGANISVDTMKAMYMGSLKDQQATDMATFNKNTDDFYKVAQSLPADSNQVLYRPNPDGTFTSVTRSSVQTNPQYDTFTSTKNGKNVVEYIDKNDPSKRKEVVLGDVDPKKTLQEDIFGNTNEITENADGTVSTRKVLDFMGNPMGSTAVTNATTQLDSSGNSYTQSSGVGSWAPPDGTVHTRGGKPAPECGQYVNDMLKTHFPDSLKGKIEQCDPTIGQPENPVQIGDAVVTNEAVGTGHVAIIDSVGQDDKGKYYVLSESNYKKKNGVGIVTNERKIYANDPAIQGFGRGTENPASSNDSTKPTLPQDNKMAWTVNAAEGTKISTAIKSGTITDVSEEAGKSSNGDPMYTVSVKDHDTGTITNYYGIAKTDLRKGSSFSSSEPAPSMGSSGSGGYSVDLRNGDGSPIQPTGNTLSSQLAAGESWGQYSGTQGGAVLDSPYGQKTYARIKADLAKSGNLDSALQKMKNDPALGQITPDTYLADLQDTATTASAAKDYKNLQTQNLQETIKQKDIRGARTVVPVAILQGDPRIQNYRQTQARMPEITNLEKTLSNNYWIGSAPNDLALVDAYVQMARGGGQINETQVSALKDYQAKEDAFKNLPNSFTSGGFLNPKERQEIVANAKGLQAEQKNTFDEAMGEYQQMITDNGYTLKLTPQNINQVIGSVIDPRTGKEVPIDQTNMGAADQFGTTMNPDGTFNVPDSLQ